MKTRKLPIITLVIIILPLLLPSCLQNSNPLKGWVVADFVGLVNDQKVCNIFYNKKVVEKEGYISMQIMKDYTPYGQRHYYEIDIPSPYITTAYFIIIIDTHRDRYCIASYTYLYEDGQSLSNAYEVNELAWITPNTGSVGAGYITLAKEINKGIKRGTPL